MAIEWKRLQLHQGKSNGKETDIREDIRTDIRAGNGTETKASIETSIATGIGENIKAGIKTGIRKDIRVEDTERDYRTIGYEKPVDKNVGSVPSSDYLVACEEGELIEYQKQLLFDVLGPVFFGEKQAGSREELADLFWERYGIDVRKDFCEGDEHYEEYREAQQAIAEGMSIYGGRISFGDCVLAELAGTIWEDLEKQDKYKFHRINTMLEE